MWHICTVMYTTSFPGHILGMRLWGKLLQEEWPTVGAKIELLTSKLLSPRRTSGTQNSKGRREHMCHIDTRIVWRRITSFPGTEFLLPLLLFHCHLKGLVQLVSLKFQAFLLICMMSTAVTSLLHVKLLVEQSTIPLRLSTLSAR